MGSRVGVGVIDRERTKWGKHEIGRAFQDRKNLAEALAQFQGNFLFKCRQGWGGEG